MVSMYYVSYSVSHVGLMNWTKDDVTFVSHISPRRSTSINVVFRKIVWRFIDCEVLLFHGR